MPRRNDIKKILIIGSGPIVIGQACEFDYSGAQACKVLLKEGYEVVLVNSNPATIMTDPVLADKTYIEPITPEVLEAIIEKERPDSLLPTMGGQTALNMAKLLYESGILAKHSVRLIGANYESIVKSEGREEFKQVVDECGLKMPEGSFACNIKDAMQIADSMNYPIIIRPSFTMGGSGGAIATNRDDFKTLATAGMEASPTNEILVESSIIGWKEFELEVMRDCNDNVVIICSIENLDPMGVHTGDSITVAPAQTLSDKEYQQLRDAAIAIIRQVGVDTGGSNVQFGLNPENGDMVVIEMNPRVSRSSALASKATGFPIAKIAAKLAVGYSLDEVENDITKVTPSSFEPSIDYCVVKLPRFDFGKFPMTETMLTTQMKSVGEVMAIGRTFKEAMQKALRSLELDIYGFKSIYLNTASKDAADAKPWLEELEEKIAVPRSARILYIADGLRNGVSVEKIHHLSGIDPWFLYQIEELTDFEVKLKNAANLTADLLRQAKRLGFSNVRLALLLGVDIDTLCRRLDEFGIKPVYKMIDTCAAEFEATTPYLYSTFGDESEAVPTNNKKVIILGGGPNRIGQGIEFDYCCCHAVFALREEGYEAIMINCNPETVSTDYDTADRLYFEPLTEEDVMNIIDREKPYGVVVQFGGQTPLKLALALEKHGVNILGTSPDAIDVAEDRKRFGQLVDRHAKDGLRQTEAGLAFSYEDAVSIVKSIGYPVMVRPSYVLGGRAMQVVYDLKTLKQYMKKAVDISSNHPVLIDKYLEQAIEVDVDAVFDGDEICIAGIMEHIEEAGVHSGDSACSLPPYSLSMEIQERIRQQTELLARELKVCGLINIQFAVKNNDIYILEVNPRGSRTVPFVSKVTGVPYAKIAMKVMLGIKLKDMNISKSNKLSHIAVKEAVFPFKKFQNVDTLLGPEMKSTGEVMGIDSSFGWAFAKAQAGAGLSLPVKGTVFLSVTDSLKQQVLPVATALLHGGFNLLATDGTAGLLEENGLDVARVNKISQGSPNIVDRLNDDNVCMVVNVPGDKKSIEQSYLVRRKALLKDIPYFTTMSGARAAIVGIKAMSESGLTIKPLQDFF